MGDDMENTGGSEMQDTSTDMSDSGSNINDTPVEAPDNIQEDISPEENTGETGAALGDGSGDIDDETSNATPDAELAGDVNDGEDGIRKNEESVDVNEAPPENIPAGEMAGETNDAGDDDIPEDEESNTASEVASENVADGEDMDDNISEDEESNAVSGAASENTVDDEDIGDDIPEDEESDAVGKSASENVVDGEGKDDDILEDEESSTVSDSASESETNGEDTRDEISKETEKDVDDVNGASADDADGGTDIQNESGSSVDESDTGAETQDENVDTNAEQVNDAVAGTGEQQDGTDNDLVEDADSQQEGIGSEPVEDSDEQQEGIGSEAVEANGSQQDDAGREIDGATTKPQEGAGSETGEINDNLQDGIDAESTVRTEVGDGIKDTDGSTNDEATVGTDVEGTHSDNELKDAGVEEAGDELKPNEEPKVRDKQQEDLGYEQFKAKAEDMGMTVEEFEDYLKAEKERQIEAGYEVADEEREGVTAGEGEESPKLTDKDNKDAVGEEVLPKDGLDNDNKEISVEGGSDVDSNEAPTLVGDTSGESDVRGAEDNKSENLDAGDNAVETQGERGQLQHSEQIDQQQELETGDKADPLKAAEMGTVSGGENKKDTGIANSNASIDVIGENNVDELLDKEKEMTVEQIGQQQGIEVKDVVTDANGDDGINADATVAAVSDNAEERPNLADGSKEINVGEMEENANPKIKNMLGAVENNLNDELKNVLKKFNIDGDVDAESYNLNHLKEDDKKEAEKELKRISEFRDVLGKLETIGGEAAESYDKATDVAGEQRDLTDPDWNLKYFKAHDLGHIQKVIEKSYESANVIEDLTGRSDLAGEGLDKNDIAMAALFHDTGMDGLDRPDNGKGIRKNHPMTSALHVLENREAIAQAGGDPDQIAALALLHSKSCSGVEDLSNKEQIRVAFEKLDAEVKSYKDNHPDSSITFDFGKIINDDARLEKFKYNAAALRMGDAFGHDSSSAGTQSGGNVDLSDEAYKSLKKVAEPDEKGEIKWKLGMWEQEVANSSIKYVSPDGTEEYINDESDVQVRKDADGEIIYEDGKPATKLGLSRMYQFGEGNISKMEAKLNGDNQYEARFDVKSANAPACTLKCIEERLKELNTADELFRHTTIIDLPENCDENVIKLYNSYATEMKDDFGMINIRVGGKKWVSHL